MLGCGETPGGKEPASTADLTIRVILQKPQLSPTENELNEIDPLSEAYWGHQGERRCAVKNNPGRETIVAGLPVSVRTFQVVLRWDSLTKQIDSTWRLIRQRNGLTAVHWNIESAVNWNEQNRWMILRCTTAGT